MRILVGKILDRILVVLGAFIFFQFPLFMHQYQLQLIGHVNELQWQITAMRKNASQSGKTLDQYIQKFIEHSDQDVSSQGATMKLVHLRWNRLSTSLLKLKEATILTRPFVFLFYLQSDIFKSSVKSFEPGLAFTLEGFLYALLGMLSGYLCFHLLVGLRKRFFATSSEGTTSSNPY